MYDTPLRQPDALRNKIHTAAYILAAVSFFPLIGIPFGIAALIWAIAVWRKKGAKTVAAIAAAGILCTAALYGLLFRFATQNSGVIAETRKQLAVTVLNTLVPEIEFYRLQHGTYPESLEQLQKSRPDRPLLLADPSSGTPRPFYYERSGDAHYYLRGTGEDKQPFTGDDILPQIEQTSGSQTGLLLQKYSR